jgi:hypothetical protein
MQSRVLARTISDVIKRFELDKVYGWVKPLGNPLQDGEMPMGTVKELEQWAIRLIRGVGPLSENESEVISHFGLNWMLDDTIIIQISHNVRINPRYPAIRETPSGKHLAEFVRTLDLMRSYIRTTVSLVRHEYERDAEQADKMVYFQIIDESDEAGTNLDRFSKAIDAIAYLVGEYNKRIDPAFETRLLVIESGSATNIGIAVVENAGAFMAGLATIVSGIIGWKYTKARLVLDTVRKSAKDEADIDDLFKTGRIPEESREKYRRLIHRNLDQLVSNGAFPATYDEPGEVRQALEEGKKPKQLGSGEQATAAADDADPDYTVDDVE